MTDLFVPFEIAVHVVGRRHVIAPAGELDLFTAPRLREALDAAVDHGAAEVVVDLTDVAFLDSTAISGLFRALARCREMRRRFAIVCPEGLARRPLELTGLADRLPLFATRRAALS